MMAREGLHVDSQTLWDQIHAIAHHLEPTYEALGRRALAASVINVDDPNGWSASTVRAVLELPLYRGEVVFGRATTAYGRELGKPDQCSNVLKAPVAELEQ